MLPLFTYLLVLFLICLFLFSNPTVSVLGENCTYTNQCVKFASYCGDGICRCISLLRRSGRGLCTLRHQSVVGEPCARYRQCADENVVCSRYDLCGSFHKAILATIDLNYLQGAGRRSEVERSLMVRWVVGSILHGLDPLSYFSFQPVLHDWCNKGRGVCYPVCGMVHIKEPLLLIDKSSLCGGSGFPFSLSEWSLTICLTPYNRR